MKIYLEGLMIIPKCFFKQMVPKIYYMMVQY